MTSNGLLGERITDEILFALGLRREGMMRRMLGPLFRLPARRFGAIFTQLEEEVPRGGLPAGARRILPHFKIAAHTHGTENIPTQGPLLVVSNHPGAYDSLAITASLPRPDLHIVVSDIPFLRALTEAGKRFIYIPPDSSGRMTALRACVACLQSGAALLIFAHGEVEPDPERLPGAWDELANWSPSVEILLRKVPETNLQLVIASGVLLDRYLKHPVASIRRARPLRQKLAEILQIADRLAFPRRAEQINMRLSFAQPIPARNLLAGDVMPGVVAAARQLLQQHMAVV
jgi:1-acyl-sn-glycerol-3-phosphate acyltransferase